MVLSFQKQGWSQELRTSNDDFDDQRSPRRCGYGMAATSPPSRVHNACNTSNAIESSTKCVPPSTVAKFAPLG